MMQLLQVPQGKIIITDNNKTDMKIKANIVKL